jgi:methyl-accepting chemotaxis protein
VKISTRITIALLVAALLPLIAVGGWSLYTWQRASQMVSGVSETALADLGQQMIEQQAGAVAREIEIYLATHPEIDLNDAAQLEANAELAGIAVQKYGEEGYTAVFDDKAITHFHPSASIIGQDLRVALSKYPDFLHIIETSLDGTPTAGYYDWPSDPSDPNSATRRKYMSIVPVDDTPLRVASTTYMDEFSQPADQVKEELASVRGQTNIQLLAIFVVVALLTSGGAYMLGRRYSQPIQRMTDVAVQIAEGDLRVEPPDSDLGEIRHLAATIRQMTANLGSLIHRVQGLSARLSAATEQVMITHRQHAANSDEQAEAVANASSAVEELASSAVHIAATANQVVTAANQTQTNARQGVEAMDEASQRLGRIATSNEDAVSKVRDLGNLAREIGMVMDLIEDIAAQTKMIALNASIEASAAGAVGRRFAVVAGEVRRLAGDVAQSTEDIRSKVERIQTTTNELIIASERESKEIAAGLDLGTTMTGLLDQIHVSAQHTTLAAEQISLGTGQQRSATQHLLADLQSLATGAQAVAVSSRETASVMEDLVNMTQDVNRAIEHFRLPDIRHEPTAEQNTLSPGGEHVPSGAEGGRGEGELMPGA